MTAVAVVHDYLTQYGGAERVALAISQTFPDAPLYTSLYQPELTYPEFKSLDVRTSFLQRLVPNGMFRFSAPLMSAAFARMKLEDFETVVVSSSGFAHHISHPNAFVYCHTPPHFIYEIDAYFSSRWLARGMRAFLPGLRRRDQRAAARHRHYVAGSKATAKRIAEIYNKEVGVIHPPFSTAHLPAELSPMPIEPRALVVARLMPYKRFDVAIKACEKAGIPLTIIGEGPDRARLESLKTNQTTFLGRVSDDEVEESFRTHSVVVMPGVEDFGLAPLEANYSGRPVVAINAGGALETVRDGENGLLVDDHEIDSWAACLRSAITHRWDPQLLRDGTKSFQLAEFQAAIRHWIQA